MTADVLGDAGRHIVGVLHRFDAHHRAARKSQAKAAQSPMA
jgi:hypothetical protein